MREELRTGRGTTPRGPDAHPRPFTCSKILLHLATSDGAVRSRRRLIEAIWGDESTPSDRCIDSHVKSLRRKLGVAGDAVETVRGVGYRFAPHPDLELD